jgi:hypothetical protein
VLLVDHLIETIDNVRHMAYLQRHHVWRIEELDNGEAAATLGAALPGK